MTHPTPPTSYFFIVGSPRSGTTLLQAMLMRAQGVFVPAESHYMSISYDRRGAMPDVRSDEGWAELERVVRLRSEREEVELDEGVFVEGLRGERTYAALLRAWMDAAAAAQGATVIGEKSPAHASRVVELLSMIPGARAIHIIRDPRDVAASQKEAFGRPSVLAAARWRADIDAHHDCERLLPASSYAKVHYEDLVRDPEPELRRLAGFLGVGFRPEMLEPGKRKKAGFSSGESHKARTMEAVTASRIGSYSGRLPMRDVAAVEMVCGAQMRSVGYEIAVHSRLAGSLALGLQAWPVLMSRVTRRAKVQRRFDAEDV